LSALSVRVSNHTHRRLEGAPSSRFQRVLSYSCYMALSPTLAPHPAGVLRPVVVSVRSHHAIVAAAMALTAASIVTQAYWLETGDDFGLGVVPAFNPAGVGNLPVFALTALLAFSAASTAVLAAALRTQGAAGAGAWALLAAGQVALSVQRLVLTRPRIDDDPAWLAVGYVPPPPPRPRDALLLAGVLAGVAVVAAAWRTAGAVRGRLAAGAALFTAGAALGAVAGAALAAPIADPRVAAATLMVAARTMEMIGAVLVFDAVCRRLAAIAPDLRLVADDAAPQAIGVHRTDDGVTIEVSPRRLGRALALAIGALVVLSTAAAWAYSRWPEAHRAHRLFYVDLETNVPTWWSAMLLLASASTAGLLARAAYRTGDDRWLDWLTLAVLFVAMASDEAASLHELLQKPIRAALGSETWLRYPLILPGLIVAVVIALHFRRFMRTIGATRRRLVIAGAIFALGALVFEMIGGWFAPEAIGANTTYLALTTTEETLEMAGATMALIALLRHVAHEAGRNGLPVGDRGYSARGVAA
jgi:hypothetical protein